MWYLRPNFSVKSNLKRHSWCSWKEEKIWMFLCNQKISLKKNLRKHSSEVHEGKKPLKCDICDYSSSQKSGINKHVESVHEGRKAFKCDICYLKFSQVPWKDMLQWFMKKQEKWHSNVTFFQLKNYFPN